VVITRKILKPCAYPNCEDLEDPRWGGFCDGHGIAPLDDRNVVIIHLRNELEKAADPELLQRAIRLIESQVCEHITTHKGGVIWTICDDCGSRWETSKGPRKTQFQIFLEKEKLL